MYITTPIRVLALLFACASFAQGQGLQLTASSIDSAACNELVTVDIRATHGFSDLVGVSYSLNWDESTLQYQSFTVLPVGSASPDVNATNALTAGELTYAWFDPLAFNGEDLADSTILLSVTFKVIGSDSPASALITGSPTLLEAYDFNFMGVPVTVQNNVSIQLTPVTIALGPNPAICLGDTVAQLTYTTTSGLPITYTIDFDSTATAAGFVDILNDTLPASPISIAVPPGAGAGVYHGVFTVKNELGCASVSKAITISLAPPVFSNCPQNIATVNDADLCGAVVNWPALTVVSNCGTVSAVPDSLPPGNFFPVGATQVVYTATDGFGNTGTCGFTVTVTDAQSPAMICKGASVDLGINCMTTLNVTQIDGGSTDNCGIVLLTMNKGSSGSFPTDTVLSFDAYLLGPNQVQLWAQDAAGNTSHCETFVIVQDNSGTCDPFYGSSVAGKLATEAADGLEDATVDLLGTSPNGLPPVDMLGLSNNAGHYQFLNAIPFGFGYTVTPTKDDNPLNGVTTFDLVLLSKHILGLQPLGSPYKIIAADANRSNSLTTFDIVEFRKLILGIYSKLPYNTSWRFVDKDYVFPDPANPFLQPFPETISKTDIQASSLNDDFVAIKVGDMNGSAIANSFAPSDDRGSRTLFFDLPDIELKVGQVFELPFKASEPVLAYQFTLELNDLELLDITPGEGMTTDNFAVFDHAITTAAEAAGTFTLRCRATADGKLRQMIGMSDRITKAEAFGISNIEYRISNFEVGLRFSGEASLPGRELELYQNVPNPWTDRTSIGFYLPEAASVVLTVCDATGRQLYRRRGDFEKGDQLLW